MPDPLRALAPAKINLTLEVLAKRDDGYHEIDTVLQALSLADEVTIDFDAEAPGVRVSGPYAGDTPTDESNLAWRAAAALASRLGASLERLAISLVKRIPPAGGLGGGASDAAATLRLLQRAWPAATDEDLHEAAASVGSDVTFLLYGGTARAQGRGERVTPLPTLPRHGVVLFVPPGTLEKKTPTLYAALGGHSFDDGRVTAAFVERQPSRFSALDVYNAFERVAYDVFPGLAELAASLEGRIGAPVRLAGAGPTLFWIGPEAEAEAIASRAAGAACTIIPTHTVGPAWEK